MSTAMENTTATPRDQARQAWSQGLKTRRHLLRHIDKLKADSPSGTDIAQFDAVEESLAQLRLACVSTIFLDFEYAASEAVEDILWRLHSSINDQYRRILQKLKHESRVVERRKVEAKYGHFLRVGQSFYLAYIQRLALRYDLPGLKRVARDIQAEEKDAKDIVCPAPELAAKVLDSCHLTLIHMGDLARYRVQAKQKKSFDAALTFYSLAHTLVPDSGYPYHQMGIVGVDQTNHLDVIYHFYRAWAVRNPHPMARKNLESRLRDAQKQNATSRGKPASPSAKYEALTMWFVRLHALFYKGEAVSSQHRELEREVIHRLSIAAKDTTKDGNVCLILLKMSLVNMSACWAASAKYNDDKSEEAVRFHQYALHFSTRFMLKLCEVMESDVQDYLGRHQNGSEGQNEADAKYPILTALLPALRIYCMWIAARRSEIFTSDNAPTNVVPPMARSLARVLTFLCAEIHNLSDEPASCPYLLPEDIETRGLQALNDDQIPAPCRSYCTEDGNLKPHPDPKPENLDAQKAQLEAQQENIARILDLLRSAYFLAEDPTVPLTCGVVDGQVAFQYQPDGVPNDIQSNAEVDRVPGENARGNLEPSEFNTNGIVPNQAQTFPSGQPHSRGMEVGESSGGPAQRTTDKYLDTMNDADKTVVNMLSPFLDCPSPQPEPGAGSPYEPSYGMHSTTANEIAQELLKGFQPEKDDPAPHYESLTPGKFGSSTWNYFFTPTTPRAHVPESTGQGSFLPGHRGSNHSSHGSVPMAEAPEDPFTTPARRAMADWQPPTGSNMGSATGSPAAVPGNQLLQAPAPPTIPRRQSFNNWSMNANPNASSWSANTIRSGPSTGQAPNPWGPHARAPAGALASSVPSTGQTPNSWAPQAPANAPAGAPASSVPSAFSHPSSLYQGTPKNGVSYGQPTYASVGKNGVHNGATQGNASPASRHFQMDQTASSYDAAIFQAAIQDSK